MKRILLINLLLLTIINHGQEAQEIINPVDQQALDQQAMMEQQALDQQAMMEQQALDQQVMMEQQALDQQVMMEQQALEQLEKWTETIEFGISDQRLAVVKKIRFDKNSNALALLENSFASENNTTIKEEIIYTFIDMQHNANIQFWTDLFVNETNLIVLQRASYAVEQMNIPIAEAVFGNMTNYLQEPKAIRYTASAIQALGQLQYAEALPIITEIATNITNHQDLRGASVIALGMYQDETLIPTLQGFLTNTMESRLIRRYAALAIGRTENPQAVEILSPIAINEQEEQTVRLNSISGLGYLNNNPDIIPILESLTKADNTAVRTEAVKSLGRLKAGRRILEYKANNDPEAIVRREAKNALKNLEEQQPLVTEQQ